MLSLVQQVFSRTLIRRVPQQAVAGLSPPEFGLDQHLRLQPSAGDSPGRLDRRQATDQALLVVLRESALEFARID
jgi:hypothetical protein